MNIGLIDVDGHNFPNFALMKISAYHKSLGDSVEWAQPVSLFDQVEYDMIYASKVFTFTPDVDYSQYLYKELHKGGTGYDIKSKLPPPLRIVGLWTIPFIHNIHSVFNSFQEAV